MKSSATLAPSTPTAPQDRVTRRNFLGGLWHGAFLAMGMALTQPTTVIAAFVAALTGSTVWVGGLSTVLTVAGVLPQLFIAPRGLITILLFYAIPEAAIVPGFEPGILLFIIIGTSLIMTWALIRDKRKPATLLDELDEEFELRDEAYGEE